MMSYDKSHDRHGKEVHRPYSSCISSIEKSNRNSIEFSLSNADKGAVGLILALELASLTACRKNENGCVRLRKDRSNIGNAMVTGTQL